MSPAAKIARHDSLRVRTVRTRRNPDARGWLIEVQERDNSASLFDERGDLEQSRWRVLASVARGTQKGRDRAFELVRAAWMYGPNLPA